MRDDAQGRRRYLSIRHDNCITCGQCERYCITKKGITLTRRWNLVTNDRMALHDDVEKELVVCEREGCGEVVGAREHLLWIAERLGPLAFANPTLMLSKMQAMGLDEGVPSSERKPLARGDRIRILCPRCRQELSLEA
jgi:ferredoxin